MYSNAAHAGPGFVHATDVLPIGRRDDVFDKILQYRYKNNDVVLPVAVLI